MTASKITTVACLACVLILSACGGGSSGVTAALPQGSGVVGTQTAAEDNPSSALQLGDAGLCTREGINHWVDAQMRDYYIFADQVPVVNPSDFEDAQALLGDLRVAPDIFSTITPQAARTALFEAGETFGFGFRFRRDPAGALRFMNIVSGSPVETAGLMRGDIILEINGVPELDVTDNMLRDFLGETGVPTEVTFTVDRGGEIQNIAATSSTYIINTVGSTDTFTRDGSTISYIALSSFLRTSEAELDAAIAATINTNPTDVILDLRYNGGGFVFVAQKLTAQLAGTNFTGEIFQNTTFNDRFSDFNRSALLEPQALNLNLPRVTILVTGATASAAEAVANNLRPYIDVVLIGTETGGKPFASVSNPNCNQLLNAMDRITSNSDGETVLGGIVPTCEVIDDWFFPMNDPNDALLGAALAYIDTNTCPVDTINLAANADIENRVTVRSGPNSPMDDYTDLELPTNMY